VADTDGPVVVEKKVLVDADDEGSVSPSSLRSVDPPNDGASHASEKDSPWSPDTDEAELERNCGDMSKLFKDVAARYDTMNDTGVIVVDWSENHFNGIGDEMQHYQELLAIAIGTGRAPFLATQRRTCEGTGLGGSRSPSSMKHLATECHFDMGDYFTGARGVDWKWDDAKEAKVRAALGDDDADELVVTWSTSGMFFGHGDKDERVGTGREPREGDDGAPGVSVAQVGAAEDSDQLWALVPPEGLGVEPAGLVGRVRVVQVHGRDRGIR
jgi:hypothetical protein